MPSQGGADFDEFMAKTWQKYDAQDGVVAKQAELEASALLEGIKPERLDVKAARLPSVP